jgi:hypothetical protein
MVRTTAMGKAERMSSLPGPVRAAVGLVAVVADEARTLPDRAIELPMLAVSTVLQLSVRAQQRYAQLAARGEDILNGRVPTDEPPPWATFDDPITAGVAVSATPDASLAPIDADAAAEPVELPEVVAELDAEIQPGLGKSVNARRDAAPSRFDAVGDE